MSSYIFTSESVTEGHPDKVCDQVSDAILDAILTQDAEARCAVEAFTKTGFVLVGGEVRTSCYVDIPQIVRSTIKGIGYHDGKSGLDYETCGVLNVIEEQSPDIARGVDADAGKEQGAGDQGMMFGYACDETPEFMPMPIQLAHQLTRKLTEVRKTGVLAYLRPDGKAQVSVEYESGSPKRVSAVVLSAQHEESVDLDQLRNDLKREVITPVLGGLASSGTVYHINPTGRFVIGGPQADTGLTGRKIVVDTYGGMGRHGGGCFSGKDPSKVDRSGAYMTRYIAKNIVASKLAAKCEVQVAYAIGVSEPVSIYVNTFGTGKISDDLLVKKIRDIFPLTPAGIIAHLDLKKPIYGPTSCYGHFGREEFSWEKCDAIDRLSN